MSKFLFLLLVISVASCRDKTKRIKYNAGHSSLGDIDRSDIPEREEEDTETPAEGKDPTPTWVPTPYTPKLPKKNTPTNKKPVVTPVRPKITPKPKVTEPEQPAIENPKKVKDHIKKKGETTAIYCMTQLRTNPLQDIDSSPFVNVLYLKVHNFTEFGREETSVVEAAKLRKSDFTTVEKNKVKSLGKTIVTRLSQSRGLSIRYTPSKESFIKGEMEFKVFKDGCLEDECVSGDYLSPFFNAEAGYYIYLLRSDYPTQFVDNRVSCHFDKETIKKLVPDLFSNFVN